MMHETSDLSFDELVDAACEELDLELNRPPSPAPAPTRRERLRAWGRRILRDRLQPPIQRTMRLATHVLNAELPVDVDAVQNAALSLTARVAHAGFRTIRWTLLAPLAPIAFARRRFAARRDEALPLHARPASPPPRRLDAPVALAPDAEAPARAPSPRFDSPRPAAAPQFMSPEAYLHGNFDAPPPRQIVPRQLFDEDAEVDLPPARDAAPQYYAPAPPARDAAPQYYAPAQPARDRAPQYAPAATPQLDTSAALGGYREYAVPVAQAPAYQYAPARDDAAPVRATLLARSSLAPDERFTTSRGVVSQPKGAEAVASPVRSTNGAAAAVSPGTDEAYALW